MKLKSKSFFH